MYFDKATFNQGGNSLGRELQSSPNFLMRHFLQTDEDDILNSNNITNTTRHQSEHLLESLWVVVFVYLCIAEVVLCVNFFIPSLFVIADKVGCSKEIVGPVILAPGILLVPVITKTIGHFVAFQDQDINAIIGPSVFHLLVVVAIGILFARTKKLQLSWWPIPRDGGLFVIILILQTIFYLGERVEWWESLAIIIIFATYVVCLVFNDRIKTVLKVNRNCNQEVEVEGSKYAEDPQEQTTDKAIDLDATNTCRTGEQRGNEDDSARVNSEYKPLEPIDETRKHPLSCPTDAFPASFSCVKYVFLLPILLPLSVTLPDVRMAKWRFLFPLTFIFSTLWMGLMSYGVSCACIEYSNLRWLRILNLGEFTHWGIPQLVAGIMLARKGLGDTLVTFAIGCAVFLSSVHASFPLFISSVKMDSGYPVNTDYLICYVLMIIFICFLVLVPLIICKGKLSKIFAGHQVLLYIGYIVLQLAFYFDYIRCPK